MKSTLELLSLARTYKRLAYLLLAFPLGLAYFVVLVTALSLGIGLAVTLIGIPILGVTMYAWRRVASFERGLIGELLGTRIPDPYRPVHAPTRIGRAQERIADPATWKDLVFLFAEFPFGIVAFSLTLAVVVGGPGFILAPLYYWSIPDIGDWTGLSATAYGFAVVPVGVLILVVGVRALDALARAWAGWADTMLGSSTDPEMTAEVVALRGASARVIEAADAERRRLERNLHDGAQQRLVSMALTLRLARKQGAEGKDTEELIERAEEDAQQALAELRDLARGIHPAILTNRGLAAALADLGTRSTVPVEIAETPAERLPDSIEAAVYFIVSESLANVAKHAEAQAATVRVTAVAGQVTVEIADDGVGGVSVGDGSGLQGLSDRAAALGGTIAIESPPGSGTRVRATLPVAAAEAPAHGTPVATGSVSAHERRASALRRLRAHAVVAVATPGALVLIWLWTGAGYFWPGWVIAASALTVAIHAAVVLGRSGFERRVGVAVSLAAFLVAVWALAGGGYFWPFWPFLALGLLIAIDVAVLVTRRPRLDF